MFSFQRFFLFPPLNWRKTKEQIVETYWIYKLIFESIVFMKPVSINSNTNWLRPCEIPWKVLEKYRSSHQRCSVRKGLKRPAYNFIKKETLAQVFSCEFCEISKNTFFTEHIWVTASGSSKYLVAHFLNWVLPFFSLTISMNFPVIFITVGLFIYIFNLFMNLNWRKYNLIKLIIVSLHLVFLKIHQNRK